MDLLFYLIAFIFSIIMIATFFDMAARLKKLIEILTRIEKKVSDIGYDVLRMRDEKNLDK